MSNKQLQNEFFTAKQTAIEGKCMKSAANETYTVHTHTKKCKSSQKCNLLTYWEGVALGIGTVSNEKSINPE